MGSGGEVLGRDPGVSAALDPRLMAGKPAGLEGEPRGRVEEGSRPSRAEVASGDSRKEGRLLPPGHNLLPDPSPPGHL